MEIIRFVTNNPGQAVTILLIVVIIIQQVGGKNLIYLIRGTQKADKDKVTDKVTTDALDMMQINAKLDTLANNHLHNLPQMEKDISEIKNTVNFIKDNHGNRLTRLETLMGGVEIYDKQ